MIPSVAAVGGSRLLTGPAAVNKKAVPSLAAGFPLYGPNRKIEPRGLENAPKNPHYHSLILAGRHQSKSFLKLSGSNIASGGLRALRPLRIPQLWRLNIGPFQR